VESIHEVSYKLPIVEFNGKKPAIHPTCYVASNATIIGDVEIGENCSIWPNAVIRGDENKVVIRAKSNVQDNAVIHVTEETPAIIGEGVVIGHAAVLHACRVGDHVLVGMNSVVLNNTVIGDWVIVAAGSVVTENTVIPSNSLVMGVPARVVKPLSSRHEKLIEKKIAEYVELGRRYRETDRL